MDKYTIARRVGEDVQYWTGNDWTDDMLEAMTFETYSEARLEIQDSHMSRVNAYVRYPDIDPGEDEIDLLECPNPKCRESEVGFVEGDTGRHVSCGNCGMEGPSGDSDGEIWNSLPRVSGDDVFPEPPKHIYIVWDGTSGWTVYDDETDAELNCDYGAGEDVFEYTSEYVLQEESDKRDNDAHAVEDRQTRVEFFANITRDAINDLRVHFSIRPNATLPEAIQDVIECHTQRVKHARQDATTFLRKQVQERHKV